MLAADLQDHLMMATNDLDRLHTLLADACDTLMQRFYNATEQIHALMDAHSSDGDDKRDSVAYQGLMQQLGAAVTALQFQDMASQLIVHTNHRLRSCVDTLAPVRACAADIAGAATPTSACAAFLAASEKARLQWRLEAQLRDFEAVIAAER